MNGEGWKHAGETGRLREQIKERALDMGFDLCNLSRGTITQGRATVKNTEVLAVLRTSNLIPDIAEGLAGPLAAGACGPQRNELLGAKRRRGRGKPFVWEPGTA